MIFYITAIVEQPKEQDKENPEDDTRKNLAFLLEKVEGCSVSRRKLRHEFQLLIDKSCFVHYKIQINFEIIIRIQRLVRPSNTQTEYYTPTRREGAILQSPCLPVHPFTLSLKMSQLLLEEMILFLIHDFGIVTCTVSPLSRLTVHLLPVYCATQNFYTPAPRRERGIYCFTSVRLSVLPSVQDIFRRIFLSNYRWQKSGIWSQASYRYGILWVAFLDPSDSYFLFADLVGFYTH